MTRQTGSYERTTVGGEEVAAFVPAPLPPAEPPLFVDDELAALLLRAETAVSRLSLAGEMVPSVGWFIYAFVRKEAVLSSQIEGTQCSLVDLLNFEAGDEREPRDEDIREVCNYLDALAYAREQMTLEHGLPLSTRLLSETHRILMRGVRGADKQPGELRRSQNWIGGTRPGNAVFVPPPPHLLGGLLSDFERYLHKGRELSPLIGTGLLHVQFETIHPFLDGNGRIGRLLVTLLLEHSGLLSSPLLYLSLHFRRHQAEYYRRLGAVRTDGDFEGWTKFFLRGVGTIAEEAVAAARQLFVLTNEDRRRVLSTGTGTIAAARLFEELPSRPVLTVKTAMGLLSTTRPTASKAVTALVNTGVLVETTGRKRDRAFSYAAYLDLLRRDTEPGSFLS
jgi:cell filamentation protein, protein adenylyltransferase